MYPAYMEESIRKVEATREKRLKEIFPRLSEEEKTPAMDVAETGEVTLDDGTTAHVLKVGFAPAKVVNLELTLE